jgi:hypothetical protein
MLLSLSGFLPLPLWSFCNLCLTGAAAAVVAVGCVPVAAAYKMSYFAAVDWQYHTNSHYYHHRVRLELRVACA